MPSAGKLNGRIALVVGASRGLGRAVAMALGQAGAHVVIAARTRAQLAGLEAEMQSRGAGATILELDVCDADAVARTANFFAARWGRLDILIANAAVFGPIRPLRNIAEAEWRQVIETNLTANWQLIHALDPLLQRSDAGRVVFITSSAATRVMAERGAYAISKAGLEMLAKTYAAETATSPIRVNLVDPGAMRTEMRAAAVPEEDPQTVPLPEAVAPLIVALSSPQWTATGERIVYREWRAATAPEAGAAPEAPTR
jgi:NAD(P)-dependent dehydrogenase (short-subunit alcohol dehydrogenase family)